MCFYKVNDLNKNISAFFKVSCVLKTLGVVLLGIIDTFCFVVVYVGRFRTKPDGLVQPQNYRLKCNLWFDVVLALDV